MIQTLVVTTSIALFVGACMGAFIGWAFGRTSGRALAERRHAYDEVSRRQIARLGETPEQEVYRRARTESGEHGASIGDLLTKAIAKRDAAVNDVWNARHGSPLDEFHLHRCEANLKLAQQQLDKVTYWAIGGVTP